VCWNCGFGVFVGRGCGEGRDLGGVWKSAGFCGEIVAKLLGARDLSAPKACMCFGSRLGLERFGG
jgi:hypothetical protein